MLQQILTITQEIKNIESKNIDLSKLTIKDQKALAKLYKELELITKDYEKIQEENKQLKDQWSLKSKENIMLTVRNNELTKLSQKEVKYSYYEIFKKFIISSITNLLTFGILKAILKRTVNPYLEKLISYVLMGVLFNNIFGNYFGFLYEILSHLLNIESIKPLFSVIGINTFTDYFKYVYEFIKRIYSSIVYESLHTPLGVINEENEIKLDKQLELDRIQASKQLEIDNLQKSNEELIKKLELFSKELQDELNNEKDPEYTKTWFNFFEKIGKDFGKTAYDSLKILIISVLIKNATDLIFKNGEFAYLKDILSKYFTKKDDSDDGSSDSLSYFSESDVKITEEKSTQTVNNEINTDVIDNEEREGIDSPLWRSRSYATTGVNTETIPTTNSDINPSNIPLPEPVDHDLIEETSDLTSSTETIKPVKEYKENYAQVNTINNSNLSSIHDREQGNLGIESQSDQGYINVTNDASDPETKKYLENIDLAHKLLEKRVELENRYNSLSPTDDNLELFSLYIEKAKNEELINSIANELKSFIDNRDSRK